MSTGKGSEVREKDTSKTYESNLSIANTPSPRYIKTKRLNEKHNNLGKENIDVKRKSFAGKISSGENEYLIPESALSPITSFMNNTGERTRNREDSRILEASNQSHAVKLSNSSYQLDRLLYSKQD